MGQWVLNCALWYKALKDAITGDPRPDPSTAWAADNTVVWSAATGGGIDNRMTKPKFIGLTGSRVGLLKNDDNVPDIRGWKGSDSSGTHSSGTSAMLRVYSNKAAAGKAPRFSVVGDVGTGQLFRAIGDTGTDPIISETNAYEIRATATSDKVEADDFPAVGAANPLGTYLGTEQRTIEGKYDGAEGTFKCTGPTCTATREDDGDIMFSAGWTFTPGDGKTNDIKDAKYLEFGWWVHKDKSKAPTYSDVFYDSSTASTALDDIPATLNGMTATYEGAAAGKFAISDPSDSKNNESGQGVNLVW